MFKDSKYTRIYFKIIKRRLESSYSGYVEKHHIIPKCLGGNDDISNIVSLSAREHFICHLLLTKMTDYHKLKFALMMMTLSNGRHKRGYKITSGVYEYIKIQNSIASRERNYNRDYGNYCGRKLYHNSLGEQRLLDPNIEDTTGWVVGMTTNRKNSIGNSNRDRVYYYKDDHVIAIKTGEEPPLGYKKGNPKADTSSFSGLSGTNYYYNPETGFEKRCKECPSGWLKGRSVCWITNGLTNKQINKIIDSLPDGWKFGRIKKEKK